MKQVYLDLAAGRHNPSSLHREGVLAARQLARARERVANVLGARPDEIIFTSGGTESNNLAIFGSQPRHLITTELEHASVLEPAKKFKTTLLSDITKLKKSLRPNTDLVSIIYAHNEIGVIQPIREIAKIIRQFRQKNQTKTPHLHLDACQAPRFLDLNVQKLGADLMTLNGSKLGLPGVGCLFVRRGINLTPMILGGGQERGLRSGTENVAGITKFAKVLEQVQKNREQNSKKMTKLRDYFINRILKFPGAKLNGPGEARLPNNVNVSFHDIDSEQLVLELDAKGIACSTGAACSILERNASAAAENAVRFTLLPETNKQDLERVLKVLPAILTKLLSVKAWN